MNDIDQTALEIARAFIPVDVVGQQRANLQVAIIEAIKKHANPKTLADVQPGGRVRLGDQAERARFEEWYVQNAFDYEANPIGSRDCALMRKAWNAALSAQPSPGGQDALAALQQDYDKLLDSFNRQVEVAEKIAGRALQQDDRIEELEEALAARQPVGEPVAYWLAVDKDDIVEFGMSADDGNEGQAARQEVNDFINGALHDGAVPHRLVGVYAAPPAQAVDLERFRPAVMTALGLSSPYGLERETLNELLDLIDSRDPRHG